MSKPILPLRLVIGSSAPARAGGGASTIPARTILDVKTEEEYKLVASMMSLASTCRKEDLLALAEELKEDRMGRVTKETRLTGRKSYEVSIPTEDQECGECGLHFVPGMHDPNCPHDPIDPEEATRNE